MLFASFPFLFLFLPILVWLWKLTAGEDKARLSVLLLGASLLFGACQGLEALLLLLGLALLLGRGLGGLVPGSALLPAAARASWSSSLTMRPCLSRLGASNTSMG